MIKFINNDRSFVSREKTAIKASLKDLFKREKKKLSQLQYVFCSDEYLLKINQDYLQHDYYTDIITFDLSSGDSIEGEVYISLDRVRENARQFGSSYRAEALRVIFHGALHLCGYRDKTKREITLMRQKESEYLKRFEKTNPKK